MVDKAWSDPEGPDYSALSDVVVLRQQHVTCSEPQPDEPERL